MCYTYILCCIHTSLEDTLIITTDTKVELLLVSIAETWVCMERSNRHILNCMSQVFIHISTTYNYTYNYKQSDQLGSYRHASRSISYITTPLGSKIPVLHYGIVSHTEKR